MKHDITLSLAMAFINRAASLGYDVKMSDASKDHNLCLDAFRQGAEICQFEMSGAMRYYPDNPLVNERRELHDLLLDMKQAHDLYADAPPLLATDVKGFRLISAFGDAVLAAKMSKDDEVRFNTWQYTYDRTAVTMGHYFETNYEGAKKDFAIRAGLLDENQLFTEDEMKVLYAAAVYRGGNDDSLLFDDGQALQAVMGKLEDNLPSLAQHHEHDNEREGELEV